MGCGRGVGATVDVGVGAAGTSVLVGVAGKDDVVGEGDVVGKGVDVDDVVGMVLVTAAGGAISVTVGGTGAAVAPMITRDPSPPRTASGRTMRLRTIGSRCGCERGRANPVNHIANATHIVTGHRIIAMSPMTIPAMSQPRWPEYLRAKIRRTRQP